MRAETLEEEYAGKDEDNDGDSRQVFKSVEIGDAFYR